MKSWNHLDWESFLHLKYQNTSPQKKYLWLWWNFISYLQFQRNWSLVSDTLRSSPGGITFLSTDLHRANTYGVTHGVFRLSSSRRNLGVPCAVPLLLRRGTTQPAPALCLASIETVTRGNINRELPCRGSDTVLLKWHGPAEVTRSCWVTRNKQQGKAVLSKAPDRDITRVWQADSGPEAPQPCGQTAPRGKQPVEKN